MIIENLYIKIEPQAPEQGVCFHAPAQLFHDSFIVTVKTESHSIYTVVESAVNLFSAVIYGLIRKISYKIQQISMSYRSKKVGFLTKIEQLVFAGGLRL